MRLAIRPGRRDGPGTEGRTPGLARRLLRWTPLLVLGAGNALSLSGWFPRREMREVAAGAFCLLVALVLGFESKDSIASRRGARRVMSVCPCYVQIPELEKRIGELQRLLDGYSAAWSAMSPSDPPPDPPSSLSAARSRKTA